MLDVTLQALADPTRRAIVARLAAGESRVTELAAPFAISLNSVSKHVRMLERAKLVSRRVAGREHFISLTPGPMDEAIGWMTQQKALWAWRLGRLEEVLDHG